MRDPILFAAFTTVVYLGYWIALFLRVTVGSFMPNVAAILGFPLMLIGPVTLLPFIDDPGSRWQLLILVNSMLWATGFLAIVRARRRARARSAGAAV